MTAKIDRRTCFVNHIEHIVYFSPQPYHTGNLEEERTRKVPGGHRQVWRVCSCHNVLQQGAVSSGRHNAHVVAQQLFKLVCTHQNQVYVM